MTYFLPQSDGHWAVQYTAYSILNCFIKDLFWHFQVSQLKRYCEEDDETACNDSDNDDVSWKFACCNLFLPWINKRFVRLYQYNHTGLIARNDSPVAFLGEIIYLRTHNVLPPCGRSKCTRPLLTTSRCPLKCLFVTLTQHDMYSSCFQLHDFKLVSKEVQEPFVC